MVLDTGVRQLGVVVYQMPQFLKLLQGPTKLRQVMVYLLRSLKPVPGLIQSLLTLSSLAPYWRRRRGQTPLVPHKTSTPLFWKQDQAQTPYQHQPLCLVKFLKPDLSQMLITGYERSLLASQRLQQLRIASLGRCSGNKSMTRKTLI